MPRKQHIISTERPYHVSSRANNKDWFALSMDETWEIFSNCLYLVRRAFNLRIHSFVLMSNHFHMLVTTPDGNLSEAMNYFLRETSKEISRRQKRSNHNFRQKYFRSLIKDDRHHSVVYKYIYQNPVRAGICEKAHQYKYSTLRQVIGLDKCIIAINDDILFNGKDDWADIFHWVNDSATTEETESIQKGLKKNEFKLVINRKIRRPSTINYSQIDAPATPFGSGYPQKKTLGDEFLRGRA